VAAETEEHRMATATSAAPPAADNAKRPVANDTIYRGRPEPLPVPERMPTPEEGAAAMFTDGCVQFPGLLSPAEVAALREWIDRSGGPDAAYEVSNWCFNKHLDGDLRGDPHWLTLMDRPPVVEILDRVLGPDCVCYGGSLWVTGQGREMGMHGDFLLMETPDDLLRDAKVRLPVFRASLHIYLDDQVEEIGPTLVIPGSHLAGRLPRNESTWNGIAPKRVAFAAGGALLVRHDVWHGAGRNTSTRRRYLIQVHYAMRWHHHPQASFAPVPAYRPELLAQTTARQRRLLGERAATT
jgi:hypothetical protein